MADLRDLGQTVKSLYPGQFDNYDDAELGFVVKQQNPEEFKDYLAPSDLTPGPAQSALRGAAQWGTLGFSDEMAGLVGSAAAKSKAGERYIDPRMIEDANDPRAPTPEHLAKWYPGVEAGSLSPRQLWEQDYLRERGVHSWQELAEKQGAEADKVSWTGPEYRKTRDEQRLRDDLAWDQHPGAYGTGAALTVVPHLLEGLTTKGLAKAGLRIGEEEAPKLLPRITRAAIEAVKKGGPMGAVAGVGGSRANDVQGNLRDAGIGLVAGTGLHLGGQAAGGLLGWTAGKLKDAAKRAFVRALDPTEGEVEVLKKQFSAPGTPGYERDPALAADKLREMETASGGKLLPATASHQTRLKNVGGALSNDKATKTSIIDQAHAAGASIDTDAVAKQAGELLGGTVGNDVNVTIRGEGESAEANQLLQRFLSRFKRPAQVMTDAAGQPMVSQPVNEAGAGGYHDPDLAKMGGGADWTGRLEGSGPLRKGENMSRGKRAALRIEDVRPAEEPFSATRDSTTRPASGTGWKPMVKPEQPFTLSEADRLASELQNDVLRTAQGFPDVKAQSAYKKSPEAMFKLGLARMLRDQVSQQVGSKLGGEAQYALESLNAKMSDMATIYPMLARKFNQGFTGSHVTPTPAGLRHRILPRTAASYVDQLLDPVYQKTGGALDTLAGLPGGKVLTKMLTLQRDDPNEEKVP